MQKNAGFTLLELVLVIIIISILAVMASLPLMQGLATYKAAGTNTSNADWQLNFAGEHLTRQIRSIGSSANILTITASQFQFIDGTNTTRNYVVSGNNLLENGNLLATNLSFAVFSYLDKNSNTTATISAVRYISIYFVSTVNGVSSTMYTRVFLPNIP